MIIAEAIRTGMDYESAAGEPLSLVEDIIATKQILEDGYDREFFGEDAEDDFRRTMSVR